MKTSVIVSTYNRPKALNLCLTSLAHQSILPSEVLIADDGSTLETRDAIEEMRKSLRHVFPITHVWHEDVGCRKPIILNEAVRQSTGEYLIFTDGDCMVHRHFLKAHMEMSGPEAILSGRRVDLGEQLAKQILEEGNVLNKLNLRLIFAFLTGEARHLKEPLYIKNKLMRKLFDRDRIIDIGVIGCNFSLSKDLFFDVNGFDEDFCDGPLEDTDVGIRVINQGKKIKSVKGLAIVFHLGHPLTWSVRVDELCQRNMKIRQRRIDNKEKVCKNGIRKLA